MKSRGSKKATDERAIAIRLSRALLDNVATAIPLMREGTPHRVTQESAVHYLVELGLFTFHAQRKNK
jgi:hypothetical protein